MTECTVCHKALSGGLDTYGDPGFELCFDCHLALSYEAESAQSEKMWDAEFRRLQNQEFDWLDKNRGKR